MIRRLLALLARVRAVPARWWLLGGAIGMTLTSAVSGTAMVAAGAFMAGLGWTAATLSIAGMLALAALSSFTAGLG